MGDISLTLLFHTSPLVDLHAFNSEDSKVSGQVVQPKPLASLKLSMGVYGQKLDGRPSR